MTLNIKIYDHTRLIISWIEQSHRAVASQRNSTQQSTVSRRETVLKEFCLEMLTVQESDYKIFPDNMTQHHNISKRDYGMVDFLNLNNWTGDVSHMPAAGWTSRNNIYLQAEEARKRRRRRLFFLKEIFNFRLILE